MDIVSVILFVAMYYLRPQEWHPMLNNLHPVQLAMMAGVYSLFQREKTVRLKDLFQTPHDFAIIFFIAWLCLTSGAPITNFKATANLLVFYYVIVLTLNTVPRMEVFVAWWCAFVMIVAALALAGEYGFDPFNSFVVTHGVMKDRLVLNLSIFNNPNSLAHSVVPVIPMLYFVMLWKRSTVWKTLAVALLTIPLYCIYLTASKGAFIAGFASLILTLSFGRPKWVQVLILVIGLGAGTGALYALPRMTELSKSKSDEAIQGRVAAYKFGYKCVNNLWAGLGYGQWMIAFYAQSSRPKIIKVPQRFAKGRIILVRRRITERYYKAAHGSFNQMGAELGFTGLALFFGMAWCSIRTLVTCKVSDVGEERVRRVLFVLLLTYLVSSWMVDYGYRATFFMFTAATAAFHRHLRGLHRQRDEELAAAREAALPIWKKRKPLLPGSAAPVVDGVLGAPVLAGAGAAAGTQVNAAGIASRFKPVPKVKGIERVAPAWLKKATEPVEPATEKPRTGWRPPPKPVDEKPGEGSISWNRIAWFDIVATYLITTVALRIWGYVIQNM